MKTTYLSIIAVAALAPVLALADDSIKDANSPKDGSTSNVSQQQQTPARGEAKSPVADPSAVEGKQGVPPEAPKNEGNKFTGTITAVDQASKTITVADQDNEARTIQVLDNTKGITGAEATNWSELNVGAPVKGVYRKDGEKLVAESLSINR